MARTSTQQQLPQFNSVGITASANGFTVTGTRPSQQPAPGSMHLGGSNAFVIVGNASPVDTYTFESFASLTKWLAKNLRNGA